MVNGRGLVGFGRRLLLDDCGCICPCFLDFWLLLLSSEDNSVSVSSSEEVVVELPSVSRLIEDLAPPRSNLVLLRRVRVRVRVRLEEDGCRDRNLLLGVVFGVEDSTGEATIGTTIAVSSLVVSVSVSESF